MLQLESHLRNNTVMPSVSSLCQDASKATGLEPETIRKSFVRNSKDVYKRHGNSALSEDEFIALGAVTTNLAQTNGGVPLSQLGEVVEALPLGESRRKKLSRTTLYNLSRKHSILKCRTIKASSVSRTDRVRVETAIMQYADAAEKVFAEANYPSHAVLATDQYVISKSKGIVLFMEFLDRFFSFFSS